MGWFLSVFFFFWGGGGGGRAIEQLCRPRGFLLRGGKAMPSVNAFTVSLQDRRFSE